MNSYERTGSPHNSISDETVPCILLADDDQGCRRAVARVLAVAGLRVAHAASLAEAQDILSRERVDAVITEMRLPDGEGVALMEAARRADPFVGRVMLTGAVDFLAVQDAVNRGAVHAFYTKPWDNESLARGVLGVLERGRLERENALMASRLADRNLALEALVRERTAALERAKADLQSVFDAFDEPLAIVTPGLKVLRANLAWAFVASLNIREVPGRTCYEALFRRSHACEGCPVAKAVHTGTVVEVRIGPAPYRVQARPLVLTRPEAAVLCRYSCAGTS